MPSALHQTPWQQNTGSIVDSSEHRRDVDGVLRRELGPLRVGVPRFRETYFGRVAGLEAATDAVFAECTAGRDALFLDRGWKGWPPDANQDGVLAWFTDLCERLEAMAVPLRSSGLARRPLAQPNTPLPGSTAIRKLDVGFARHVDSNARCSWSQILVPGELKNNPAADTAAKAWLDLGTYAREVFANQDTRRFVLGFTICGSLMRLWLFDRLGGVASEPFDLQ
jgi:hypothetical protein